MLTRSLWLALACLASAVLPAWAHHSHSNYDTSTWTTMEGTVREVHRLVPHSWIYMDVTDGRKARRQAGRSRRRGLAGSRGSASRSMTY